MSQPEHQDQAPREPLSTTGRLMSLLVMEIFLLSACMWLAHYLFSSSINGPGYFIVLVFVAMCAAGFVFGFLESTGTITGQYIGTKFKFGGAAAFALLIMIMGSNNVNDLRSFRVKVVLTPPPQRRFLPNDLSDASVTLAVENGTYSSDLTKKGEAWIEGIPFYLRSKKTTLTLNSDNFIAQTLVLDPPKWDEIAFGVLTMPVQPKNNLTEKFNASNQSSNVAKINSDVAGLDDPNRGSAPAGALVTLLDGFKDFNNSSYNFSTDKVVPWNDTKGDIGVATPPGADAPQFFLPFDALPYTDGMGSHAEIAEANDQMLENGGSCKRISNYQHFYVPVFIGKIYCIKFRYGELYRAIRVINVSKMGIQFSIISKY